MAEIVQRTWRSGPRKVKRSSWGYTYQRDGQQFRKYDSAWSREDAEQALASAILGQAPPAPVPTSAGAMTLGEAVAKYLGVKASEGKRSIQDDRRNLARLTRAFGASTPLPAITASVVADYKVERPQTTVKRDGKRQPIAPGTITRELASLRHLLRLAVEDWEILEKAPVIRTLDLDEPEGRLRFLSEEEIARLLDACTVSRSPHLWTIVVVALNTGMRRNEILRLTWERVDFSRGVLLLEGASRRSTQRTKSGKRREVPMTEACDAALNALPGAKVEGPVFRKANGKEWGNIRHAWDNAVTATKLVDFHFHDLRHTFASHFMMRGGNVVELREILGHADIKMTMIYAHLSPAHLRGAVDKLAGLTPPRRQEFSTTSAHGAESEPATSVSPRHN